MSLTTQAAKQEKLTSRIVDRDGAFAKLISPRNNVVTVIGNEEIRNSFDIGCLDQIVNIADAPGVDKVILNPDGHAGYGCPIGSVFSSRDYIYPCAVGPDIKCSMSFLQMDLESKVLDDKKLRRELINAIEARIPLGSGSRQAPKARQLDLSLLKRIVCEGANSEVLSELGIDPKWSSRCEDASHGYREELEYCFDYLVKQFQTIKSKLSQIGSVGGGNHFLECNTVKIKSDMNSIAKTFGLKDKNIGFLNHFGSRGFGYFLTEGGKGGQKGWFRSMIDHFDKWKIPFPGGDSHCFYMPFDSVEGKSYLNDMYLAGNFATVNHLVVCAYILEAFKEVLGQSVTGNLVYYIAHNIIRNEVVPTSDRKNIPMWVHRKGATRALPAGHFELKDTEFYKTGHPILLPGNPIDGSTIMVGLRGSENSLNSVNHGAGRSRSRKAAKEMFKQKDVDAHFEEADILTNCRQYPIDECSGAYKSYGPVIESVELAGLAKTVAVLKPRMLIKDGDQSKEGSE